MPWCEELFDWSALGSQDDPSGVPQAMERLIEARAKDEASKAYWQIDNVVVVQGVVFQAAVPTAACLVVALPRATEVSRPFIMELLVQIGAGVSTEPDTQTAREVEQECMFEISLGAAMYFHFLEFGTEEERCHCVDLLGICCRITPSLRARVGQTYRRLLTEDISAGLRSLVENWMHKVT